MLVASKGLADAISISVMLGLHCEGLALCTFGPGCVFCTDYHLVTVVRGWRAFSNKNNQIGLVVDGPQIITWLW